MTDRSQHPNYDQRIAINQKIAELDMSVNALISRVTTNEHDIREFNLHRDYSVRGTEEMKKSIEELTETLNEVVTTVVTAKGTLRGILWLLGVIGTLLGLAVAIYALK